MFVIASVTYVAKCETHQSEIDAIIRSAITEEVEELMIEPRLNTPHLHLYSSAV